MIHPTAIIYPNVTFVDIESVHIGAYCVIGGPPEDKKYFNKDTGFGVVICANVRLSEFVTVHAGTTGPTCLGYGSMIFTKSHIAHDCIIDSEVIIGGQVSLAGHTYVMSGANISGKAATVPKTVIGAYSFLGANSLLTKHLPPGEKWVGFPAKFVSNNDIGLQRSNIDHEKCVNIYGEYFKDLAKERPL